MITSIMQTAIGGGAGGALVVPAASLVSASPAGLLPYGVKAAGYAQLIGLQPECPAPFSVPEAWAVPARSMGQFTTADIRAAFDALTAGLGSPSVLMARSSAIDETPGANPTLSVAFDPTDREGSFRRLNDAAGRLLDSSDKMGVLLTRMVGEASTLPDGTCAFGAGNISLVADSHSPINPSEMHIAAVHGLGTRAVDAGGDPILITVSRADGKITCLLNQTDRAARVLFGSIDPVNERKDYRQQGLDYFDLASGEIRQTLLPEDLFIAGGETHVLANGQLWGYLEFFDAKFKGSVALEDKDSNILTRSIGAFPFGGVEMFRQLVSVLTYLQGKVGPVQVEGAFPAHVSSALYLYQLLKVPSLSIEAGPLRLKNPYFSSNRVMGKIDFRGPLVWIERDCGSDLPRLTAQIALVRELDRRFSDTGYILLAPRHGNDIIGDSRHCRIRLSAGEENASSHVVTDTRIKLVAEPNSGYFLATNVSRTDPTRPLPARARRVGRDIVVIDGAYIVSNGAAMALEFVEEAPQAATVTSAVRGTRPDTPPAIPPVAPHVAPPVDHPEPKKTTLVEALKAWLRQMRNP